MAIDEHTGTEYVGGFSLTWWRKLFCPSTIYRFYALSALSECLRVCFELFTSKYLLCAAFWNRDRPTQSAWVTTASEALNESRFLFGARQSEGLFYSKSSLEERGPFNVMNKALYVTLARPAQLTARQNRKVISLKCCSTRNGVEIISKSLTQ